MTSWDSDAAVAAADLVARTGARNFQVGYLHEDRPSEEADWYAHAQYRGARVTVEHHVGPVEAAEALARRLLEGAVCQRCGGLIGLSEEGVRIAPGARMADGTVMTAQRARSMRQCHWRRAGARWRPGCEAEGTAPPRGPSRRDRRAAERAAKKGRKP